MSDAPSNSPHGSEPSDLQVLDFLRRRPDFLTDHPDLLAALAVPGRDLSAADGAPVVDLQKVMLDRLRGEIGRLHDSQGELLATTRNNVQTQTRVHAAVLSLLRAHSLAHLAETVTTDLAVLMDVDVVALCLEAGAMPRVLPEGVRVVPDGTVTEALGANNNVRLRENIHGDKLIYGSGAGLVRSDALLRLHIVPGGAQGLLAFGCRDHDYFRAGQATELVCFLAQVLEHSVRAWLDQEV